MALITSSNRLEQTQTNGPGHTSTYSELIKFIGNHTCTMHMTASVKCKHTYTHTYILYSHTDHYSTPSHTQTLHAFNRQPVCYLVDILLYSCHRHRFYWINYGSMVQVVLIFSSLICLMSCLQEFSFSFITRTVIHII